MDRTPAERCRALFWDLVPGCRVGATRRNADWIAEQLRAATEAPGDRLGRYIFATGLLSYGRLEAAEIILDNLPRPRDDPGGEVVYFGTNAIRALLPLPRDLRGEAAWQTHRRAARVRDWLGRHRESLRWEEHRGVFVLES